MPAKRKKRASQKSGSSQRAGAKKAATGKTPLGASDGPPTPGTRKNARPVPIVGIGASAGGLDALTQFFKAMPSDSGAAFVVIQHLDPKHESLTAELLDRHASMRVVQVTRSTTMEPDHVYVIPPNALLSVEGGSLRLSGPIERRGVRMTIDYFFRSLARDGAERAIGVVLSGTGTDGTLGLKEIKAAGG